MGMCCQDKGKETVMILIDGEIPNSRAAVIFDEVL